MAHRQQRVGIAVDAVSGQVHPPGHGFEARTFGGRADLGIGGVERRLGQRAAGARAQRTPGAIGSGHLGGAEAAEEALADIGLVDEAQDRAFAVIERDQGAPCRQARDEGAGPVDRVDDPGQPAAARDRGFLLAVDAVFGAFGLKQGADRGLGLAVGQRHRVEAALIVLVVRCQRGRAEMRQRMHRRSVCQSVRRRDQGAPRGLGNVPAHVLMCLRDGVRRRR